MKFGRTGGGGRQRWNAALRRRRETTGGRFQWQLTTNLFIVFYYTYLLEHTTHPTFGQVHHNMLLSRSQGSIVTAVAVPWSQIDLHNGGLKWGTGALGFVVQLVKITCPRPRGWMQLRELMQHSTVGHGSGRGRLICCYDHAVYVCVVNAIPFLCCGVGYKYSNNNNQV